MKKLSLLVLAAAAMCSCSLEEREMEKEDGFGSLNLEIRMESATKAASTLSQDYESKVNSLAVLAFDKNGTLAASQKKGSSEGTEMQLMAGEYDVWAVVNGPDLSEVSKLSQLQAFELPLSLNSTDLSKAFVMGGHQKVTILPGKTSNSSLSVSRYTSRIQLGSIKNELPAALGDITLENVFLCNVPGVQNVKGNLETQVWYNKDGRADEATRNASHIIDGTNYLPSCPTLTFSSLGKKKLASGKSYSLSKCLMYSYPNSSSVDPTGFRSEFAPARTVVCVTAVIAGKRQYYPVTLSCGLERNKSYMVNLTIVGLGSDDPVKPVEKGSCNLTLTVNEWSAGSEINESI